MANELQAEADICLIPTDGILSGDAYFNEADKHWLRSVVERIGEIRQFR
jgi:hypothetical protein